MGKMATVEVIALILVSLVLYGALLRAPRWFSGSIHRHRLWRLRDEIADDMIDGVLPAEHDAVRALLTRAESTIRFTSEHHIVEFYAWYSVWRKVDAAAKLSLRPEPVQLTGLSTDEQQLVERYRDRLATLSTSSLLLSSWIGIASILRFVPVAIKYRRDRSSKPLGGLAEVTSTMGVAADKAAIESSMGQLSRDYFLDEPTGHLSGVA